MNKELPYHTSNIVQRYLQLKKIAHYESGVIISIVVSLFLLTLVFMGSHIGTSFSVDPIEFSTPTEGGGLKVLGIQKGGNEAYGSFHPYMLLGKVEQLRGIWNSENNVMLLGDESGTALPRYISSQYVFPKYGNWSDQEYEQYLQAISASSISPIQQLGVKEDLNRDDVSSNFSCLGRSWTPSYFCKDKLPQLVDIIPRFVLEQRKSAYLTLYEHVNDSQYQGICNKLLQTIVLKKDYFAETKQLIEVCQDKSLVSMYESAKILQGFHAFIDKPEVVMSFAGIKDPVVQHYMIVSLIQDILQGITVDRDNVVLLESFALTIDSFEGQKNIDKNYLGLLSYFNKAKLQPYFAAKVGATITQRETYDRVTSSFKNFDKNNGALASVAISTGTSEGTGQFDRNGALQKATGLIPDRMITTDQKVTSLFVIGGKRYILSIGLTSGNVIELYRSEPGVGNTKLDTAGITFEIKNYAKIAEIFSGLKLGLGETTIPKTESEWKQSFEKNIGSYAPQIIIRGETVVAAFTKTGKKFALVINQTTNQIKVYQVIENDGNKLISTINGTWSTDSFSSIKSLLK